MRQYKAVLVERSDRACPQQLLLFSSRWSEQLREFAMEFMCEPSFIIASPMDISYYGQVRQVHCERTVDLSSFTADDVGHLSQRAAAAAATLSQKTSRLWLEIWSFFNMAADAILDFGNVEILGTGRLETAKMRHRAKFRGDRSNRC